eukprot:SM000037S13516  [mRNA]  locus=s37:316675:318658:- [translate_table: standard]
MAKPAEVEEDGEKKAAVGSPLPEAKAEADKGDDDGAAAGGGGDAEVVAAKQNGGGSAVAAAEEASRVLEAKDSTKAQQSFALSGKLAEETNKVRGVALLFTEPPEARKPTTRWRLYVFKDGEPLNGNRCTSTASPATSSAASVVDVPTDHPSCSKQHAVIQFRLTDKEDKETLETVQAIRPYLMDLGSTNGTFLNGKRIEAQRYVEMLEKDTVKFGNSSPVLKLLLLLLLPTALPSPPLALG